MAEHVPADRAVGGDEKVADYQRRYERQQQDFSTPKLAAEGTRGSAGLWAIFPSP
jgi:hypothetical protein